MFKKYEWGHGLVWFGSEWEQVAGCCGYGNELCSSTKYWEMFDYMKNLIHGVDRRNKTIGTRNALRGWRFSCGVIEGSSLLWRDAASLATYCLHLEGLRGP